MANEIATIEPLHADLQAVNPIVIDTKGVEVPVIQLAVACGLLMPVDGEPGFFQLDPDWFSDPVNKTGEGLSNNAPTLALVIAQLIGQASGSSLGIPAKEPGALGTWYPINKPGTDQPSGLYLTTQPVSSDANAGGAAPTVFGIGVRYTKPVTLSTAELASHKVAAAGPTGIVLSAWGLIPLIQLGGGTVKVVAGQPGYPFTMGFEVTAGGDGKLVDVAGFSFQGVRVSLDLSPTASPAVVVSLVVTQLQLPTDAAPKDRTLADLEAVTGAELLATAAALAVAALGKLTGDQPSLPYLLPALGLGARVPAVENVLLPILRWDSFVGLAIAGGDIAQPFVDWFTALASDGTLLSAWIQAVGGAVGGLTGTVVKVIGSGTRASPFAVPVFSIAAVGTLSLTAGSMTDAHGVRHFYPGLTFAAKPFALGSSGTAITGSAALEVLDFALATAGSSVGVQPGNFNAGIQFTGAAPDTPLYSGTILGNTYTFGSLTAGLAVLTGSGGASVQPAFSLVDVKTPTGQYDSIDLTQPGQIVSAAEAELNAAISQAFDALFGLGANSGVGASLAGLMGVAPPPSNGAAWPSTLTPPFSAGGLATSIQFPVKAFGDYYAALIRGDVMVGGKPAFFYMVQALGSVLRQTGGVTGDVTGSGTLADPWTMAIGTAGGVASILAYVTTPDHSATRRLILGIGAKTTLPIAGNALDLAFRIEALGLDAGAGAGTGIQGAQILPGIGFYAALANGLTTPEVAGAKLQIASASMSVLWSPYDDWTWSMSAAAPTLIVDGVPEPVGTDMNYSNSTSLQDLVRDQASTFGAILTGVLGIALYRAQRRGGLALDGWLGLLPNLGPFVPKGIEWPATMPVLRPTSFNDPIGQLRGQIKSVLATGPQATAALGLLGWAIDTKAADAAPINGSGTESDPWLLPLGLPWGILGTLGQDSGQTLVAPGFAKRQNFTVDKVRAETTVRFVPLAIGWATGKPVNNAGLPRLSVETVLSGVGGPLVSVGDFTVESVTLGVVLSLDLSGTSPVFIAEPVITAIQAPPGNAAALAPLELSPSISPPSMSELLTMVNAGINEAAVAFASNATFKLVYATLAELGLAIPAADSEGPFGIDPGGWRGLVSAPLSYLSDRLMQVLADPKLAPGLFQAISDTLGFSLPPVPEPLLALLAGMGIVTDKQHGYAPNPPAIIAVFRAPATELSARLTALLANPVARSAVIATMTTGMQDVPFGAFKLTATNGRFLSVVLPRGKISLGGFLLPSMTVRVDLESGELAGVVDLYQPDAGFSLATSLSYTIGGAAPAVTVSLVWGDGSAPAPESIVLWPFNPTAFIDQLATVAPAYVLSTIINEVVGATLLVKYPLAGSLLQVFGLAERDPTTAAWQMKSTLGLFEDPVGWLLSDAVVGADGKLNIPALRKTLLGLPPGTAAGLTLSTISNGVLLSGLPYGLQVSATADPATGLFSLLPALTAPLPLLAGAKLEKLGFGLSLTADCQPGVSGLARLSATIPGLNDPLFLEGGYDKGFNLKLGETGTNKPVLDLVPFGGWQTFVLQIAAEVAQNLLQNLSKTLLDGLAAKGDARLTAFVTDLRSLAGSLQIGDLVQALIAAQPDPAKLEAAALSWLSARLQPANAAATAKAVADLLAQVLTGVSSDGGLISYAPSKTVPITILAGIRTDGAEQLLGVWASLAVSAYDTVFLTIAPTGLGVTLTGTPAPRMSFGLTAQTIVAMDQGPGLAIGFDGGTIKASFDPMMTKGAVSPLARNLLPLLFDVPTDPRNDYDKRLEAAVETWLLDVLKDVLPRFVSVVVLNTAAVNTWLEAPLFERSSLTPGQLLTGSELLLKEQKTYVLAPLESLATLGVGGFLANFLKTLTQTQIQVLSFPDGGGIWLEPGPNAGEYGVRFAVTGLSLKSVPYLVFQLGATDTGWMTLAGADPKAYPPGIAAYVPLDGLVPKFAEAKVRLNNIGVDFKGKAGKPLVDLSRFQLGSIKPRGLLTFDFAKSNPIDVYGGGLDLEDIAISLAPNALASGPNSNPVAQNLLGSGNKPTQNNPAANPAFSARGGWYSGGHLGFELYDANGDSATRIWLPVQRDFGPVHANKIGVGWDNASHIGSVMFDGSLALAGLKVDLIDLSVGVNVTQITDYKQYSLDLGGLEISFTGGSVQMEGGLLKQTDPLRYDGRLLVKAASFTIYAVGSFALIPTDPAKPDGDQAVSFFIFLNLNAPLGGPPAFFIEGVAGGFSINRNIIIPDAGDIMSFPLIQGAISKSTFGGDPTPDSALAVLSKTVYPEIGTYWVAAGLKFSSFQLVDVFAMLLVKFGREWEIDIIGVASAGLPPKVAPSSALAYVELGLVASFKITQGEISITAQLTPNSFLLAKNCKLTGGFAIKIWFGPNVHAGNFIITLGGYHPAFQPPDFYPTVPRLGFNWPVLDTSSMSVSVSGGTYFALTPSMIMAGGYLKAQFTAGPLKAWFDASADFLISWQPFYYSAGMHISVGISFSFELCGVNVTLAVELGAGLDLWGPPTAGRVNVNWFVISFTIPIGDQDQDKSSTKPLGWPEFEARILPPPAPPQGAAPAHLAAPGLAAPSLAALAAPGAAVTPPATSDPPGQVVLNIDVTNGLLSQEGEFGPTVQSAPFAITARSVMPASAITVTDSTFKAASPPIGITPMNLPEIDTPLLLTLEAESDTDVWTALSIDRPGVLAATLSNPAVAAVWSPVAFNPDGPPTAKLIPGAVFGVTISTVGDQVVDPLKPMDLLKAFGYEKACPLNLPFSATPVYPIPAALPQTDRFAALMGTVMAPTITGIRQATMQALEDRMVAVLVDQNLSVLATFADQILQAAPSLARMGFDLAATPQKLMSAVPRVQRAAAQSAEVAQGPRLLGMAQSYTLTAAPRHAIVMAAAMAPAARPLSIILRSPKIVARWSDIDGHPARGRVTPAGTASAVLATDPAGTTDLTVRPGLIAVLSAGSGPGIPRLDLAGASPLRVYTFDEAGRILSDVVRQPSTAARDAFLAAAPENSLPADTHQVALVGLDNGHDATPPVAGWSAHSTLFQVGHHTLLGSGCTVRPQASPRLRQAMREQRRGPMEAASMLRENRVQSGYDRTVPGWVETVFGHTVRTVAVVLGKGAASEAHVQVAATNSPWKVSYGGALPPARRIDAADGTILLYDVTPATGGQDRHAVLVRGAEGLSGVYGFAATSEAVAAEWSGLGLPVVGRAAVPESPAGPARAFEASAAAEASAPPTPATTTARLSRVQPSGE